MNYPESLVERCNYLERENKKLKTAFKEVCDEKDSYIDRLRHQIDNLHRYLKKDDENTSIWFWQGDGYDCINSMASDLPVIITARELRNLLSKGEITYNGSQQIIEWDYNINGYMKVKLTEFGLNLLKKSLQELNLSFNYIEQNVKNGYLTLQFHEIMTFFGQHLYFGGELPFETDVVLIKHE